MLQFEYRTIRNTEKIYPHKKRLIVFKVPYQVPLGIKLKSKGKPKMNIFTKQLYELRSLNRTKITIKDIILCNRFEMFCTFTFKDHRDDVDICKVRMQYWLQSQQKQYGSFDYLIVPEFHHDGKALHFHALFIGYKGKLTPAISTKTGKFIYSRSKRQIYDLSGWRSGFAEATYIDNDDDSREKVANYVTKYITKEMPLFLGKKRYWVSRSLERPIKGVNVDMIPYLCDEHVEKFDNESYTTYVVYKTHDSFANLEK